MKSGYCKKVINANNTGKKINILYPIVVSKLNIYRAGDSANKLFVPRAKVGIPISYLEDLAETFVDAITENEEMDLLLKEIREEVEIEYDEENEFNVLLNEIEIVRQNLLD